jgi:serine/threonine-protein kinase HipA
MPEARLLDVDLREGDLHERWRRIVFSVLISNTDDHLRNDGFLYAGNRG